VSVWGYPRGDSLEHEPEREPPRCPYCGRVMSHREAAEQGACNDCYRDVGAGCE
jgi:ribosomal protein L37AE/L43A